MYKIYKKKKYVYIRNNENGKRCITENPDDINGYTYIVCA